MSDQEKLDPALLSLQEELKKMSEDVPEMPESFRTGWREAIRREAAEASRKEGSAAYASPAAASSAASAEAPSPSAGPAEKPAAAVRKKMSWQRIISIAAVAVFILGGALISQDALTLTRKAEPVPLSPKSAETITSFLQEPAGQQLGQPVAALSPSLSEDAGAVNASASEEEVPEAGAAFEEATEADAAFEETAGASAAFKEAADASAVLEEAEEEAEVLLSEKTASPDSGAGISAVDPFAVPDAVPMLDAPDQITGPEESIRFEKTSAEISDEKKAGSSEQEQASAAQSAAASPLRIAGYVLIGLAFVLAALLLILRRR